MAKALSDLKRKKIVADYAINQSYSETARMNGVSLNGVKKIVLNCTPFVHSVQAKKEENTLEILEYMESTKDRVCKLIDNYLDAMLDEKRIDKAKLGELSTVFGTVIDKYVKIGIVRVDGSEATQAAHNITQTIQKVRVILIGVLQRNTKVKTVEGHNVYAILLFICLHRAT